jgi:MFS family permease
VFGWLADRADRLVLLASLGVALAALAAVLAAVLAAAVDVDGLAYVAAFALGGVVMAFYAIGLTVLGERVAPAQLVVANTTFLFSYEAGAVGGPLLGGLALDLWRPHGLAVVVAAVGLLLAGYVVGARRTAHRG